MTTSGSTPRRTSSGKIIRRVAVDRDGLRLARGRPALDHGQRLVERLGLRVQVAGAKPEVDAVRVAFHRQAAGPGHRRRERLRPSHAPEPRGQDPAPPEVAAVVLAADLDERLVRSLHDPLAADVDPRPRRHLAVHGEPLAVELVEVGPGRPVRHQVRVRDQHPRRVGVGAEHADRLARLHEQGLVLVEPLQGGDDAVEVAPRSRGAADAAVDHQLVRVLRHVGVEVVHQHPHRRLGQPGLRGDLGPGGRTDGADVGGGAVHRDVVSGCAVVAGAMVAEILYILHAGKCAGRPAPAPARDNSRGTRVPCYAESVSRSAGMNLTIVVDDEILKRADSANTQSTRWSATT